MQPTRHRRLDRGAAAVEFALVAILLITLVVGIFEGGRVWMIQGALSQAAREGAREMAIRDDEIKAKEVITKRAGSFGAEPGIEVLTTADGCVVRATAKVENYRTMTGLLELAMFDGITLTGKADMRCGG
ncbi:TadE/TadG family type IV pilus assembly protein [Ornithinimicrobium cryptoxanthini]|uniref:TadE/TadG family type IV pilus assembly protein n=1 Tax=Ornithinimicrobium cryptoxanthini TaxID=2934161 RepID=UPI00351C4718